MPAQKQICYVMPYTENFREERPRLCWEYMYGWIDGYGVCFDPVIQNGRTEVPLFCNGAPESVSEDQFYITSCREATLEFFPESVAGLFLCPDDGGESRRSMKERLQTPVGNYFYPVDFPVVSSGGDDPNWLLGEKSVLKRNGKQKLLYFELFSMLGYQVQEFPHKRLKIAADMLAELLALPRSDFDNTEDAGEFRLDCQCFGISRLFLQWTLRLLGEDPEQVSASDAAYLEAVKFYAEQNLESAVESLKNAFDILYQIRTKYIPLDLQIAEFPHAGILLPESGFFELEWPEGTRGIVNAHLNDVERNNYAASFELSGSDWCALQKQFPEMVKRVGKLWDQKKIDLTNGTWGLPYAFVSPMNLQYFQFRCGQEAFRSVFGRAPELYECQENSLTPQMPELLVHFGYKKAIHTAQNHGTPKYDDDPQIRWTSPSGSGVHALTASKPEQVKLGLNFFLDLPLQFLKYKDLKTVYSFNMMDLGYIPFRECLIRAARYAPLFGRFILASSLFNDGENLPAKTYTADDYKFSSDSFYRNYTNRNALSHFEQIFGFSAEWRALQMLWNDEIPEEKKIAQLLCTYEAHDCDRVQGQRPGEFYIRRINETSPNSRLELRDVLTRMRGELRTHLDSVYESAVPGKCETLFNPAEVVLPFAEVKNPEKYSGEVYRFCGRVYAAGTFAPLALGKSQQIKSAAVRSSEHGMCGGWTVEVQNDQIVVEKNGKRSVFAPVDFKSGAFQLQSAEYLTENGWLTARFVFLYPGSRMGALIMEGITTETADYIEWNLRYVCQEQFEEFCRWNDFLGLAFEYENTTAIRNFVPSMMNETKDERIITSSCLELVDRYSLLFPGVGNFRREDGKLYWLFHVASETVYERRMIVSFGSEMPALLSRGLQSGLIPAAGIPETFPSFMGENISLECRIEPGKWLISNMSDRRNTVQVSGNYAVFAMDGTEISDKVLLPWQIAILKEC